MFRGASGAWSDYDDLVNRYEINWVVGVGVRKGIGGSDVLVDIRYALGLTKIFDIGYPAEDMDANEKNQLLSASVSVTLF